MIEVEELFEYITPDKRPTERVPDSHLQSPIRSVYRQLIYLTPQKWPAFVAPCLSRIPVKIELIDIHSEVLYGTLLSCVYMGEEDQRLQWVQHNYPECTHVVGSFLKTICNELGLQNVSTRLEATAKDILLISHKVIWEEIRSGMQDKRLGQDTWTSQPQLPYGVIKLQYCSQYAIMQVKGLGEKWFLMDYDQIMMVTDTVASRVFTLIYNDILPEDIPGKIPRGVIERLYQVYDKAFLAEGNTIYAKIAKWESICIAVMLHQYDRLKKASSYYEWLLGSLQDEDEKLGLEVLNTISGEGLSIEALAELHGLYRHWGHPTVNEELGCEKVKNIAQNRPIPDSVSLLRMAGALKRQFVSSFVSKHGRWPRLVNMEALRDKSLYFLASTQSLIINFYSPEYPLEDWGLLRFDKEFEFDYHLDYTDLLEDRSISVKRSEIRSLYSSDALGYKRKPPSTDRRVLREALKRPTIDVKSICDQVQIGNIPEEWKIIIIHAKEREMKIAPRLFAMMTFEMRLYFSITEANIKDKVFSYFPQQTMTLDEADLSKRLFTLTSEFESIIRLLSALLGIDFSSWNLCWTFLSTFPVFQFLDDIFGTPGLFLYTHQFFESCVIALASHYNPPTSLIGNPKGIPEECNELWYNHLGGFEGLRQKGWTLCTIALLLLVESLTGLKSYIIGQGDNQVCKLVLPIPDEYDTVEAFICSNQGEIGEKIDKFSHTLSDSAASIGLHVKLDETWVGMDILVYGKEILYKGAFMPQGLKRIARLLTDVNEIYPTLHTKISTLQTSGMSCAQKSYDICTPYFLSTVEVLMTILRDLFRMHHKRGINQAQYEITKSITFKEFLLCLSSDVGSCPILSFLSFLYRGHPDPLTTYTTWIRLLQKHYKVAHLVYLWLSNRCYQLGQGDCELLVSNPCSLNLQSPETISTKIRRDLETSLITFTKNRDLKEIFSTASKQRDASLFKYLISMRPCHPRVAHEIFRNTITGTKLSFLSKFSNTRTTQTIFSETKTHTGMMTSVDRIERDLILHWLKLYNDVLSLPSNLMYTDCPTRLAQSLRDDSWTKALDGKVIEGVTIPHPVHQFCFKISDHQEDHQKTLNPRITYMIPEPVDITLVSTRGPYPAYVGSSTREKRTGKMYTIPQASRPLKSAERLIQLRDWVCVEDGNLFKFITEAAKSRTNMPVSILEDTTAPIIGGSVTHRLDDHVTKRGTLHNFRPNITTHIYYSTDTMGRFSQGSDNFNMHFQGAVHYGMSLIELGLIHQIDQRYQYGSLTYQADCCEEILEDFLMDTETELRTPVISENNPLLFAKIGVIPRTYDPDITTVVQFVKSTRSAEAIGFILFSRFLSAGNVYQIGMTEKSNPLIGTVGVAEIMGAGLYDIFEQFAKYMHLYLPIGTDATHEFTHAISASAFQDIATICLLPDVLPELCALMGFTSAPEMFCSKDIICRMIAKIIERFLYDLERDQKKKLADISHTIFYPSTQVGFHRILEMWRKQVWIMTDELIDLGPEIDNAYQLHTISDYHPNAQFIQEIVLSLLKQSDNEWLEIICQSCPLRLSNVPAHAVARDTRGHHKMRSFVKSLKKHELKSQVIRTYGYTTPYVHTISCDLQFVEPELVDLRHKKSLTVNITKNRLDQTFRLFGTISTAFLKIYEILILENLQVHGSVITLAEGEGSIADLLVRLGADRIYYNSLINRAKLVEQRAPGLVPTCLAYNPSVVEMGELTAMTGGDLCDPKVLESILAYIPTQDVSIVTCDAESSGNFAPHTANKIFLAWLSVCTKSSAATGIFKTFCHNADVLTNVTSASKLMFKDVKVVTPCYSSYETHEVYLVCKNHHPAISLENILYAHKANMILRCKGAENLTIAYRKFKSDRVEENPLQEQRPELILKMWKDCESLGIQDNGISNLHRITLFNCTYTGQKFTDWVVDADQVINSRALVLLKVQADSYHGIIDSQLQPRYIPKHHVLHTQIESLMTCLINLQILKEIIGQPKDTISEIVDEIIDAGHVLRSGNQILYSYRLEHKTWRKAYLKNMCRLWGHWRHQKSHNCSIHWE